MPVRGSVRLVDGSTREMPLAELTAAAVLSAVPWRAVRSHHGQHHFPGLYWSAMTGGHVVYESRLELARLLLADFDPEVVGIAAQPFLVWDADRRHVPDFFLSRADGSVLIVNVKPAERLEDTHVTESLGWAGRVFAGRGWKHEVWSGADAQLLANVRFLAGYRRAALVEPLTGAEGMLRTDAVRTDAVRTDAVRTDAVLTDAVLTDAVLTDAVRTDAVRTDAVLTIAGAETALRDAGVVEPRAVVLHLLWRGRLRADLEHPLTGETALEVLW